MIRHAIALCFLALPAWAEPVSLDALTGYVRALKTAETRFTQYNADGSRAVGTLQIQRPGRMRFEYDPPNDAVVLANGGVVAIFDANSNAEPQQFPLRRTPLNLILGRNVDFSDEKMVFDHYEDQSGLTVVAARDPKNPDSGMIELYFSQSPLALTQWVITNETGDKTGVDLGTLDRSVSFDSNYFSVQREEFRRSRPD